MQSLIQFGGLDKEMPTQFWEKLMTFTRAKLHPALDKAVLVVFASKCLCECVRACMSGVWLWGNNTERQTKWRRRRTKEGQWERRKIENRRNTQHTHTRPLPMTKRTEREASSVLQGNGLHEKCASIMLPMAFCQSVCNSKNTKGEDGRVLFLPTDSVETRQQQR